MFRAGTIISSGYSRNSGLLHPADIRPAGSHHYLSSPIHLPPDHRHRRDAEAARVNIRPADQPIRPPRLPISAEPILGAASSSAPFRSCAMRARERAEEATVVMEVHNRATEATNKPMMANKERGRRRRWSIRLTGLRRVPVPPKQVSSGLRYARTSPADDRPLRLNASSALARARMAHDRKSTYC